MKSFKATTKRSNIKSGHANYVSNTQLNQRLWPFGACHSADLLPTNVIFDLFRFYAAAIVKYYQIDAMNSLVSISSCFGSNDMRCSIISFYM